MRKKNDILLKSAFEEFFPDLLHFFFRNANDIFNFDLGFEFLDKELSELFPVLKKKVGSRFVDMLVKAHLQNGEEEWILVHIEIQGEGSKDFPKRMHQYWYRIYDRYEVDIVALAVFTGNHNQKRSNRFHKEFLGTRITYEYNVYHILDHSEHELLAMNNPFALIVLAAQKTLAINKIPEVELGFQRLAIAKAMIQMEKYDNLKIKRFLFFLKTFVHIENSSINFNFEKEIALLTGQDTAMGIIETITMLTREEALEEGEKRKSLEFVTNLLLAKRFSTSEIANFAGVSKSYVKKVEAKLNS